MTTTFRSALTLITSLLQDASTEHAELLSQHPELQHQLESMVKLSLNALAFEQKIVPAADQSVAQPGLGYDQLTTGERFILAQLKRSNGSKPASLLSNDIHRLLEHGYVVLEDSEVRITSTGQTLTRPAARAARPLSPANVLVR